MKSVAAATLSEQTQCETQTRRRDNFPIINTHGLNFKNLNKECFDCVCVCVCVGGTVR